MLEAPHILFPSTPPLGTLPGIKFDALCRSARLQLGLAAAAVRLQEDDSLWIDLADGVEQQKIRDLLGLLWPAVAASSGEAAPPPALLPVPVQPVCNSRTQTSGAASFFFYHSLTFGPHNAGRLVLFATSPKQFSADETACLESLRTVAGQILLLWQTAQAAKEEAALFRLLAETSTDTIVLGNLDGERLYVSPSVRSLLGYAPEELMGRQAVEITHPDDRPAFRELMRQVKAGTIDTGKQELRQRHKNGEWIWMEAAIRLTRSAATGEPTGYVVSVRGIRHHKEREAKLNRLASYDALTGLPNRAFFTAQLRRAVHRAKRAKSHLSVLFMDLDGFKKINDSLGHKAGDSVLREVAERLCGVARGGQCIARLGGDEFTAVLAMSPKEAQQLAQKFIDAVAQPFAVDGSSAVLGLSIGIACMPTSPDQGGISAEELLARADAALYEAKDTGGNVSCIHAAPADQA